MKSKSGLYQCGGCRGKYSVRVGTIFEQSHLSLQKWLYAVYLLQTSRKGISPSRLSKELGIQQRSAWFLLHRLRETCDIEAIRLPGIVETNESHIGQQAVIYMEERGGNTSEEETTTYIDEHGNHVSDVEQGRTAFIIIRIADHMNETYQ